MASVGSPTVRISRRILNRYLLDGEVPVVATREHWVRLVEPFASALVSLILVAALSASLEPRLGPAPAILWVLWLVVLGRAIVRLVSWSHDWFVATDRRMLKVYGLVEQRVAMMPLKKVTDMSYHRSLLGRMLGYGEFVLESAGQEQAMRAIRWVPDPDEKYRRICATIFGDTGLDEDDLAAPGPGPSGQGPRPGGGGWGNEDPFDQDVETDPFDATFHDEGPSLADRFDPDIVRVAPQGARSEAGRPRTPREHLWEPVERDELPQDWEWVESEPPPRPRLRVVSEDRDRTGPLPRGPRRRR